MTDIRTIDIDEGLDALRSELKYTELRLLARDETRSYAAAFTALLGRWAAVRDGQLAAWDAEDAADVAVANADDDIDDTTALVDKELLTRVSGRDHEQYQRFFGSDTVKAVQRLGLESQLARTADWPASLATMGIASGTQLAANQTAGRAALDQRVAAGGARADHRVRVIQAFFDDANALRRSTFGGLITYAAAHSLPPTWAQRPFRKGRTRRSKPAE